ncbi:MAG: hypothetical protein ACKOVA_05210 [Novosphingobium sp.]
MKILIIHDRDVIGLELKRIAQKTKGSEMGVDYEKDVWTARDKLRANFYDLVVIDLTLPLKFGKTASLENTEMLLEEIFAGEEGVKAPADVLGISRDPDVLETVSTTIGQHIMACIREDVDGLWKAAFEAKVRYAIRARTARQLVLNSSHGIDVLIITALDKEAQPYKDIFEFEPSEEFERAKSFTFAGRDSTMRSGILFAIGHAGQPPCGSMTQALLTQFRPKLVIMTGFCGGVADRVNFGDLVAFSSVAAWDYGKWEERDNEDGSKTSVFRPRPTPLAIPEGQVRDVIRDLVAEEYKPNAETLAAVSNSSSGKLTSWKLRLKAAGSGSAVVTSLETLGMIVAHDEDIWAIDMESYALYFACRNTPVLRPDFVCIKGVADHCNGEKNSQYHTPCSIASARLAHEIIAHRYKF